MTYHYVSLADSNAAEQHRQHLPVRLLRAEEQKIKTPAKRSIIVHGAENLFYWTTPDLKRF
jgi:hypothetical protein